MCACPIAEDIHTVLRVFRYCLSSRMDRRLFNDSVSTLNNNREKFVA